MLAGLSNDAVEIILQSSILRDINNGYFIVKYQQDFSVTSKHDQF